MAVEVDHDVLRLEVAVDDLVAMKKLEGQHHFAEVEPGLVLAQPPLLQVEEHLAARVELQQEIKVLLGLEGGEQLGHEGEVADDLRHDLFLPQHLLHTLELDKVALLNLLQRV